MQGEYRAGGGRGWLGGGMWDQGGWGESGRGKRMMTKSYQLTTIHRNMLKTV